MKELRDDPPISSEVDLRRYPTLPLDVQRLRDSDFVALASADEFRAFLLLLSAAWHQIPAGSLPIDDRLLCALAKTEMKSWKKVKLLALRGFVEHSDGRLYHPVLTETVLKSWGTMRIQKSRTAAATAARKDRHDQRNDERDVHQRKGKERNINETPPPQGVDGGGESGGGDFVKKEVGLGDMLAKLPGFEDQALVSSLNKAAAGASPDQLERAVAVIKEGGSEIKSLAGWALAIARRASSGQVTSQMPPMRQIERERPERQWDGKAGWRIKTEQFGELTVEINGMLRSTAGILHPSVATGIAALLKSGELTLLNPK
jgi:uncharacterized protein YdaU (DUF1376 family)